MKISNSKKQLARIISENGGWRDGVRAVYGAKTKRVCFLSADEGAPEYAPARKSWVVVVANILAEFPSEPFANWHQTILSRDEYFHLYPAPDADGWIEWNGGERPVCGQTMIDVKFRYGACATSGADCFNFTHDDHKASDIIAYRLHKPEQPKSTAVGDDDTNLAAKEELEAMEYRPSIEQLAADYRAKLAIAQQAQEEADSHRCGAEAALERLYQAGLAIGIDIAAADSSPEDEKQPELVITDWGDLRVGDEVECIGYDKAHSFGNVTLIDELGSDQPIQVLHKNGDVSWPSHWRFIRRP